MTEQHDTGETAIVIGGGIAGLLAARVLADYFRNVTIFERDTLCATGEPRKGVPQGRHAHALLARGQQVLEELFPGLTHQLIERGAVQGHGRFWAGGGYLFPIRHGPGGLFVSRPCLESAVRARVLSLPNVGISDKCSVRGLATSETRSCVTGVWVSHSESASDIECEPADLVVDASGRGSRAPSWLEDLGYAAPAVDLVEVGMGYSTRIYRRDLVHLHGDVMVNVAPAPGSTRACGMMAQEGDRWIVTLAGYFGDHPPTDDAGFLEFARSLPVPDVYEVIRTGTPITDATTYRFPSNQRRRYEKLERFPEGFLVIGDALCSFTPIYGQGMTVAALEALALGECLRMGTRHLARRYFSHASAVVNNAWSITVGNDARLAGPARARRLAERLFDWYLDRLHRTARKDARVASAFLRVANLIDAPTSLLHPRIAAHVLLDSLLPSRSALVGASVPAHPPAASADCPRTTDSTSRLAA